MNVLAGIRDGAIILLALSSIAVCVLVAILIVQIQRLIRMLREEIKPVIESTNETVSTVRGTATFMSEHLVSPLIEVSGIMAGLRRAAQVLVSWPTRKREDAAKNNIGDPTAPQ